MTGAAQLTRQRHPLDGLLTVMWHYVRDTGARPSVGAGWVEPDAFEAQLDRIARVRTVVGWPAVADALDGRSRLPPDAALLTFDDGLADHHDAVLPRLAARGLPAVFFVTARRPGDRLSVGHRIHVLLADRSQAELREAVIDRLSARDRAAFEAAERRERDAGVDPIDVLKRPLQRDLADTVGPILSALIEERHGPEAALADALHLSPAQVARLRSAGMTIGGHGHRHLWLDWEPADRVRNEIRESARFLASERRPWAFAYPYGASSPTAVRALAARGFAGAFHAGPIQATGRFDLGRIDGEDGALEAALAGPASPGRRATRPST